MANGFTQEQEAFIEKVAWAVVDKAIPRIMEQHVATCPVAKTISRWKALAIGIAIGIMLASGATAFAVAKLALAL